MDIFESVGLSFTRSGTNTERIQSVFDKTSVRIRIFYAQTWNENEDHGLLTPFDLRRGHRVCVASLLFYDYCYYPAKASMEERGILVRSLFFQKNTISPRRSYNFKWQDIYVGVNFLSQVIFVFLLFWGMVMYANEVATKEK